MYTYLFSARTVSKQDNHNGWILHGNQCCPNSFCCLFNSRCLFSLYVVGMVWPLCSSLWCFLWCPLRHVLYEAFLMAALCSDILIFIVLPVSPSSVMLEQYASTCHKTEKEGNTAIWQSSTYSILLVQTPTLWRNGKTENWDIGGIDPHKHTLYKLALCSELYLFWCFPCVLSVLLISIDVCCWSVQTFFLWFPTPLLANSIPCAIKFQPVSNFSDHGVWMIHPTLCSECSLRRLVDYHNC